MNAAESLRRFGTIMFSTDEMNRLINYGRPIFTEHGEFRGFETRENLTSLNVTVWLAFVPDVYRDMAERLARNCAAPFLMRATRCDETARQEFIKQLHFCCTWELELKGYDRDSK